MRGRSITPQDAQRIKKMLYGGTPQDRCALLMNVSQATVSRIKNGKAYEAIPWPDGSTGAMPTKVSLEDAASGDSEWSVDARRYLEFETEMQERIRVLVNAKRDHLDLPPIPGESETYRAFLNAEPSEDLREVEALLNAKEDEEKRCATIMQEFDVIVAEQQAYAAEDLIREGIATTREERKAAPVQEVKPPVYSAYTWEEVLERVPNAPFVENVQDPIRREAIGFAVQMTENTVDGWVGKGIKTIIDSVEAEFRKHPSLCAEIVSKHSKFE